MFPFNIAALAGQIKFTSAARQDPVGAAMMVAGAILSIWFPTAGGMLIANGALRIAGTIYALSRMPSPGDQSERSPAYGFDQLANPTDRDAVVPVTFSADGHPVAPPYLMAFSTPAGVDLADDDFSKATARRGQRLSALWGVAPHRCASIANLRINNEDVFRQHVAADIGTGNGTKKAFVLAHNAVLRESLSVAIDGTEVYGSTARTAIITLYGGQYVYTINVTDPAQIDDSRDVRVEWAAQPGGPYRYVDDPAEDPDGTFLRPIVWLDSRQQIRICTQRWEPAVSGRSVLRVTYYVRDFVAAHQGSRLGFSGDKLQVTFATAPASGKKVTASYLRRAMGNVDVQIRYGTTAQLPLLGFNAIRQSQGLNLPLDQGYSAVQQYTTRGEVDDVIIDIGSVAEFRVYDDDGGTKTVVAQISIEYAKANAAGAFPATLTKLKNPAGANAAANRTVYEFALGDDSPSRVFWSFSLRGLLKKQAEKSGNWTEYNAFTRGVYKVAVWRTNLVRQDSNSYCRDAITLVSVQEVRDEFLAWPGTALVAAANINPKRTGGGLPRMRVDVQGDPDTPRCTLSGGSYSWGNAEVANAANPVWAACRLWTAHYGGGEWYTLADNVDAASAVTAAAWTERLVSIGGGATERATKLSMVLDTRSSLFDHITAILRPSGVVPFLRGEVLHFALDRQLTDEELDAVPEIVCIGASSRVLRDTFAQGRPSLVDQPSEISGTYLDATLDHEKEIERATPEQPVAVRRERAIDLWGVTRRTEARRVVWQIKRLADAAPRDASLSMTVAGVRYEPGDVVRVTDERQSASVLCRVRSTRLDAQHIVHLTLREYVHDAYEETAGQSSAQTTAATTNRAASTSSPTQAGRSPVTAISAETAGGTR